MRSAAVAVLLCSLPGTFAAHAAILRVAPATIDHVGYSNIEKKCGGPNIAACTTITTRTISSCAYDAGQWRVNRYVLIEPHIFTSSGTLLTHEFVHIADVVAALKKRSAAVESPTFESEDVCIAAVGRIDAGNARALLEIERETAHRRDAPMATALVTPLAAEVAAEAAGP